MQLLFLLLPLIFQASGVYEIESDTLAQGQPALGTNTLASDGGSSDSAKSPVWHPGQLEPVPLFPALLGRNKLSCASYHLRLEILMSQSTVPAAPQHTLTSLGVSYVPWSGVQAEQLQGGQPRGVTYALGEKDGLQGVSSSSFHCLLPWETLSHLPRMLPQLLVPSAQVTLS